MKIYLLFACDTWKSADSFRLVMATTNKKTLLSKINKEIKGNNMELSDNLNSFNGDLRAIDTALTYGYIQEVENVEEL